MDTVVTMVFGSHLYGTNTPSSDLDYKAVYIPEAKDILLGRVKDVVEENTKTDTSVRNSSTDVDRETFALQKYLQLLSKGQTVALDMLFAPAWNRPLCSWQWPEIQANKGKLISKQCQSYIGYCRTQANKYGIKGSRMGSAEVAFNYFRHINEHLGPTYRLNDVASYMERELAGLEHVEFLDIANPAGAVVRHISVCGKKVPFTQTVKEAAAVYSHLYNEYGIRARQAKDNQNIDWKALSHAVRVGRQAIELLNDHHITFPRPEAKHLVAIKTGELPFDAVADEIETLLAEVETASTKSTLPDKPDQSFIDQLVFDTYKNKVLRN